MLGYVNESFDCGLVTNKAAVLYREVFSDVDWASDSTDRRSVSRGAFKVFEYIVRP